MTPSSFLAAVLPSAGRYVAVSIGAKGPKQTFHSTIESLVGASTRADTAGLNAYFALANFGPLQNRTKDNALTLRSAFIDVDVGENKEYQSLDEAKQALGKFLLAAELPMPLVVGSGYGLHVYWTFTADVPVAQWYPVVLGLKTLCITHGFSVDHSVIGDAARILRVPGTHNYKIPTDPKGVRVLSRAFPEPIEFSAFAALTGSKLSQLGVTGQPNFSANRSAPPSTALALAGLPPNARASTLMLVQDTKTSFRKILVSSAQGNGCMQVKHYLEHASDDGMEPLWRGIVSLAKVCFDGEKLIKQVSDLHPYTEERLRAKWEAASGPQTCPVFDRLMPGICPNCPKYGKTNTPLLFGTVLNGHSHLPPPLNETREKVSAEDTHVETDVASGMMDLPQGYTIGPSGGIYRNVSEIQNGESTSREVPIVPYTIGVAGVREQEETGSSVHMFAELPGGRRTFIIPSSTMVSKAETLKALAERGIFSVGLGESENALYAYLRTAVSEYTFKRASQAVPDTYGWQKDGSFVLNDKKLRSDGHIEAVAVDKALYNLYRITKPTGNLASWQRVVEMISAKERYDILLGMTTAFGAPLMELVGAGLNGLVLHLQSPSSGTGKSISLSLASSVYGHPQQYGLSVNTSDVAAQHRMGMLHSLPLVMDEVTNRMRDIRGGDTEWINRLLMDITTGKGKERLEAATISERKNVTTWATIALLSSNTSIIDALGSRAYTTQGEMMRLLEVEMHTKLQLGEGETRLLESLNSHYGVVGMRYIMWLVTHKEIAKETFAQLKDSLSRAGSFSSDERFWLNGLAAMLTGATLAGPGYADLITLPVPAITMFAIDLVKASRRTVREAEVNATEHLQGFLRLNFGKLLILEKEENATRVRLGLSEINDQTLARNDIKGRVEIGYQKGMASVYIDRKELSAYCNKINYSSSMFKRQLQADNYIVTETVKSMFTDSRLNLHVNAKVVCITMSQERLEGLGALNQAHP